MIREQNAADKVQLETTAQHLRETTRLARAAMDAKGAEIHEHLKKSIASAKAAIEA